MSCHAAPEFAIKDNIHNNGGIPTIAKLTVYDHNNTRSPSLRDLINPDSNLNGPLMHNGSFTTLLEMIEHYNDIDMTDQQLVDPLLFQGREAPDPIGQQLNLSNTYKEALANFLKTLTGNEIYTKVKWSNPFIN